MSMGEMMVFPKSFDDFAKMHGFKDREEIYTNGSELIPVFRVKQWLEHIQYLTTKNDLGVEQYRKRMIEAFHNADCDSLIALVVQPTEKEFKHLEWLLKTHYKTPQETKTGEWVSVKDRLPEDGAQKIVTYESGEVGFARFVQKMITGFGDVTHNVWVVSAEDEDEGEVVAWRPLPEPYKESEGRSEMVKLKPCDNIARCRGGWLSPNGDCYSFCYDYSGHELLAEAIIETLHLREKTEKKAFYTIMEDSDFLESLGWIRLSTNLMWGVRLNEGYWKDRELTQAQTNILFDWCNVHAMDFPPQLKKQRE